MASLPAIKGYGREDQVGALTFFFGDPAAPEKLKDFNEHHAATYHFPDAFVGQSTKIRDTLNNLVLHAVQTWQTSAVGLPFRRIEGTTVEWDEMKFDMRLLQRVPPEGVSRMQTSIKRRHRQRVVRRGIGMMLESDFYSTEAGRQHFANQLQSIKYSVQETCNFDVLFAYLSCDNYDFRFDLSRGIRTREDVRRAMLHEINMYAIVQREGLGFDRAVEEAKFRMGRYDVKPNLVVVAPELLLYVAVAPEEKRRHSEGGDLAVSRYEDGVPGYESRNFRGLTVVTSDPFNVHEEGQSYQMLRRSSQVGEFYVMSPPVVWDHNEILPSGYMDILVYDEELDMLKQISFKDAFEHATNPLLTGPSLDDFGELLLGDDWRTHASFINFYSSAFLAKSHVDVERYVKARLTYDQLKSHAFTNGSVPPHMFGWVKVSDNFMPLQSKPTSGSGDFNLFPAELGAMTKDMGGADNTVVVAHASEKKEYSEAVTTFKAFDEDTLRMAPQPELEGVLGHTGIRNDFWKTSEFFTLYAFLNAAVEAINNRAPAIVGSAEFGAVFYDSKRMSRFVFFGGDTSTAALGAADTLSVWWADVNRTDVEKFSAVERLLLFLARVIGNDESYVLPRTWVENDTTAGDVDQFFTTNRSSHPANLDNGTGWPWVLSNVNNRATHGRNDAVVTAVDALMGVADFKPVADAVTFISSNQASFKPGSRIFGTNLAIKHRRKASLAYATVDFCRILGILSPLTDAMVLSKRADSTDDWIAFDLVSMTSNLYTNRTNYVSDVRSTFSTVVSTLASVDPGGDAEVVRQKGVIQELCSLPGLDAGTATALAAVNALQTYFTASDCPQGFGPFGTFKNDFDGADLIARVRQLEEILVQPAGSYLESGLALNVLYLATRIKPSGVAPLYDHYKRDIVLLTCAALLSHTSPLGAALGVFGELKARLDLIMRKELDLLTSCVVSTSTTVVNHLVKHLKDNYGSVSTNDRYDNAAYSTICYKGVSNWTIPGADIARWTEPMDVLTKMNFSVRRMKKKILSKLADHLGHAESYLLSEQYNNPLNFVYVDKVPVFDNNALVKAIIELVAVGVYVPLKIVIARPFIEHHTLSAVMTVSGSDTGETLFGPADMQISANTSVKTIEGHYTCYTKAIVTKPDNVFVMRDLMCTDYVAGSNTSFFKTAEEVNNRLQLDQTKPKFKSMFAFVSPFSTIEDPIRSLSITGRTLPWEVAPTSNVHFPGGEDVYELYSAHYNLHDIHTSEDHRMTQSYAFMSYGNNSVCFPGPYRRYNQHSAALMELVPGQGHFGPDAIPGDCRWRRGESVSQEHSRNQMVSLEVAAHSQLVFSKRNK